MKNMKNLESAFAEALFIPVFPICGTILFLQKNSNILYVNLSGIIFL